MSALWLLACVLLAAIVDWFASYKNIFWLVCITKPLVIIALGVWLFMQPVPHAQLIWFLLALLFSLAGDVFLLNPMRFLMAGLLSFIIAQISYVIGLNNPLPAYSIELIYPAIVVMALGSFIFPRLLRGIRIKGGSGSFQIAALFYCVVVSLMAFSASSTLFRSDWERVASELVSVGGLLFFLSDTLLAYDRFVHPIRNGRLYVHILYHLGQIGLITGIVRQMMK